MVRNSTDVSINDNYIHVETKSPGCCDTHDGIVGEHGNHQIMIQGNIIAYGETNIEFTGENSSISVVGNFLLNPRGPEPRGQNFQCWGKDDSHRCSDVLLEANYALASSDIGRYRFVEGQEDSINLGITSQAIIRKNYISGGHSASGCGIIADDRADRVQFLDNVLINTGQCGIGIADGKSQVVVGNRIYNSTEISGGGNTAIYAWKQYAAPCGPTIISNNVADMVLSGGKHNPFWDGGGCAVVLSGNIFGTPAVRLLAPITRNFPPPPIPPKPKACVARSPYTTNTATTSGLPMCFEVAPDSPIASGSRAR